MKHTMYDAYKNNWNPIFHLTISLLLFYNFSEIYLMSILLKIAIRISQQLY